MAHDDILTIEERRQQRHRKIIQDILRIARSMMQADGVAALSFNGIARQLGIKPPSLYTYFDSKDAIYDTLFRTGFQTFEGKMNQGIQRDTSLAVYLRSLIWHYMEFALINPDLFQLMFQRPVPGFVPSDESLEVSFAVLQTARDDIQTQLEAHSIHPATSIEETTDLIIAMMHGLTEMQLANNPEKPVGEGRFGSLIEPSVQLFLDAWQAPLAKEESS